MGSNGGRHVLVVEDDVEYREALRHVLEAAGYRVSTAGEGHEAISIAAETSPDVAIVDLILPDANGIAICQALTAGSEDTPSIIAITARRDDAAREWAAAAGVEEFLVKPVDASGIVAILERLTADR